MLILIADDEAILLEVVSRILEVIGHEVIGVLNGMEALEALHSRSDIDLTILDENMPGMTGREVLSKLREFLPDHPVILSSGYQTPEVQDARVAQLQKPYKLEQLEEVVNQFA